MTGALIAMLSVGLPTAHYFAHPQISEPGPPTPPHHNFLETPIPLSFLLLTR